jgi:DNA polymerase iota
MNSDSLSFSESESEGEGWLASTSLISQTILHLDVDCFYCQCHEVQDPSLRAIPFAIGQKHIIVTSNYVARRFGVKKLMSKTEAQRTCPSLRIIDGSDLTEFRKKSHLIYSEFRKAVQQLKTGADICVKKGGMDEMFADISQLVNERMNERSNQSVKSDDANVELDRLPYFIYGNDHESKHISIAEDQSGAMATISHDFNVPSSTSTISNWGSIQEREECKRRLLMGAEIAHQLQEKIRSKTEFTTCIGVSVSPMLSKLASDLKVRKNRLVLAGNRIC